MPLTEIGTVERSHLLHQLLWNPQPRAGSIVHTLYDAEMEFTSYCAVPICERCASLGHPNQDYIGASLVLYSENLVSKIVYTRTEGGNDDVWASGLGKPGGCG